VGEAGTGLVYKEREVAHPEVALVRLGQHDEDLVLGQVEVVRTEPLRKNGIDSGHAKQPRTPDPLLVCVEPAGHRRTVAIDD
jgi:uncharacterized protein YqfB (UPF0267 family)